MKEDEARLFAHLVEGVWFTYRQKFRPALSPQCMADGGSTPDRRIELVVPQTVYFLLEDVRHVVYTEAQAIKNSDGEDFHFRQGAELTMANGQPLTLTGQDAARFAHEMGHRGAFKDQRYERIEEKLKSLAEGRAGGARYGEPPRPLEGAGGYHREPTPGRKD